MKNYEQFFLGFDISTSTIGIAIYTEDRKPYVIEHLNIDTFDNVEQDNKYIYKALSFENKLISLNEEYKIKDIFVEAPLKNAKKIDTVVELAKMNAICCYSIQKIFNIFPKMLTVRDARALFCPEFLEIDTVYKKNKNFNKKIRKYLKLIPETDKKTPFKKYSYVVKHIDSSFDEKPTYRAEEPVWKFPQELDQKEYMLKKIIKKYPFLEKNLEYNSKNILKKENYDRTDACVVVEAGLKKFY